MKYFHKKKLLFVIIFTSIFIGAVFVFIYTKPNFNELKFERTPENSAEKALGVIIAKDSDDDGLKDWEESLWKTDPKNPDSDGDGTPDGQEVRENRDPSKPAPGDEMQNIDKTQKQLEKKEKTLTQSVVSQYITAYSSINQDGITDDSVLSGLKKDIAAEIDSKVLNTNTQKYTESDLIIIPDNVLSVENYRKKLQDILDKYKKESQNDIYIVNDALKAQDSAILKKLDKSILTYKNIVKDLLLMEVPERSVQAHLNVINAYSSLVTSVENMKFVLSDPITGLAGIAQYKMNVKKLLSIKLN